MTKQRKLRHSEYYDLQECFDELYAKSKDNYIFTNLMNLIKDENNIKLAYRNIKRNSGSNTCGTDIRIYLNVFYYYLYLKLYNYKFMI